MLQVSPWVGGAVAGGGEAGDFGMYDEIGRPANTPLGMVEETRGGERQHRTGAAQRC